MFRAGLKTGFLLGIAAALIAKLAQTTDRRAWQDAQTAAGTAGLVRQEQLREQLADARAGRLHDDQP